MSVRPSVRLEVSRQIFRKNPQISNFIEIRLVGAELFHADGQTDRHDEAKSHSLYSCENV